jgi:hypothetical protein
MRRHTVATSVSLSAHPSDSSDEQQQIKGTCRGTKTHDSARRRQHGGPQAHTWGGARTVENEDLQVAKRGDGPCKLLHHVATHAMAVEVQEDQVRTCLQLAHELPQLKSTQFSEAFWRSLPLQFAIEPAVAVLA